MTIKQSLVHSLEQALADKDKEIERLREKLRGPFTCPFCKGRWKRSTRGAAKEK